MPLSRRLRRLVILFTLFSASTAYGAGGPLGIDHRGEYEDHGIWKRSDQLLLMDLMIGGEIVGAVWEGGESRLGRTFWKAIDSSALAGLSTLALKGAFTRDRPSKSSDPNNWFDGSGNYSFPSAEVAAASSIVTPFVLEYRHDYPAVYALELLPLYDAIARTKVWGHWQSDVLAGFALGTATGIYAHSRKDSLVLSALPNGFMVGIHESW